MMFSGILNILQVVVKNFRRLDDHFKGIFFFSFKQELGVAKNMMPVANVPLHTNLTIMESIKRDLNADLMAKSTLFKIKRSVMYTQYHLET